MEPMSDGTSLSSTAAEPVEQPAADTVTPSPAPPVAKKVPHETTLHGETLRDDYFWMREKEHPDVRAYLEAENAYTTALMQPSEPFQETLYREMLGRIQETDLRVPYRQGDYFYYSRTEEGKQYSIYCRKRGSLDAPEEVTLDLNALARGEKFLALGAYAVTDDGNLLAYSIDTTGFREYTLYIKDLRTGELGSERIPRTSSVAWASDNRTLFYVTEDPAKRPYRLYRHRLGESDDTLVLEETDERFRVWARRTRSRAYLLFGSASLTATEIRTLRASEPEATPQVIAAREPEHEYDVDHRAGRFYIRTNSGGRNFRLVTAPVEDPRRENWEEIVPHREAVMLEGIALFAGHAVLREREEGLPQLRILDRRSGASQRVAFPEPAYTVSPAENAEFDTVAYRFTYQSLTTPPTVYDYDMATQQWTLLKREPVLGGYDPERYQSERLFAAAADGARVPISIVYRKGTPRDGKNPLVLMGYGSYGAPMPAAFSSARVSLLDRGVIYAVAHIRGGGEMGKRWHDEGRLLRKRNTFTDFIAAAEHLIAEQYTASDRLVIEGGSAGGLLMGAVVQMRPELFKAVVTRVPFVDVINTMSDPTLPLTVGEFEEWGNPQNREQYDLMKSYCPYTNVGPWAYPTMLVKTSLNDSQVMYWEPAKWVAKVRAMKTDSNLLLLKTNMAGGHGGSSGRYDHLREVAFDYAFMLMQLGIRE
jgi:oligopeptidase B